MDLGCLDLGCISVSEKSSTETHIDATENVNSATKTGKSKSPRGTVQSAPNALNKFTSQIKKPPHRKNSPINWFPRKKVDSYLKRKIKMLQEIDGMSLSLDETLGDSNPHYSRVLREKIAAREAAQSAMEARKAALVEASWCKILGAARIHSKEAEELLLKADKTAAEAFEAATALGVIMYDKPNFPPKGSEIETSVVNGGRSTTHTVTASFETAFEVDKEVAAAIRTAFMRLASCPSFDKDEFKELLTKISQNPDINDSEKAEKSENFSSEYESESGSEVETTSQFDGFDDVDKVSKLRKSRKRQSLEKFNVMKLVDTMLERLRCLKEDELSSLVTIVATCGLNAALAEEESGIVSRRMSTVGSGMASNSSLEQMRRKQVESELPSLDKFLVKHMSKLEKEVQEAKNSRENTGKNENEKSSQEKVADLEKEIEAAKNSRKSFEYTHKKPISSSSEAMPGLESVLIKHSSKLEKEVQEAKNRRNNVPKRPNSSSKGIDKENIDKNLNSNTECDHQSLDKVLVKHVSRLEKAKMEFSANEGRVKVSNRNRQQMNEEGGLDQILVKHKSKLEREKLSFASSREGENGNRKSVSRREARERELQEAWGGLGLGNSIKPHISRLEKDKAAWIKAEEEERRNSVHEV